MIEFSNIQSRKARQRVRIFKLKDIKKNMKELKKRINDVAESNKGDTTVSIECKDALAILDEDSR